MFYIFYRIEHRKQLQKLYPEKMALLEDGAASIMQERGGVGFSGEKDVFQFSDCYSDAPFYVLDCVQALKEMLDTHASLLYGYSIIISSGQAQTNLLTRLQHLAFRVTEEDGIWIDPGLLPEFSTFIESRQEGRNKEDAFLVPVRIRPQAMVSTEQRYRRFLSREELAPSFQKELDKWLYRQDETPGLMLCSSCSREEIQSLLNAGFDENPPLAEPCLILEASLDYWDPWRPFVRFIDSELLEQSEGAFTVSTNSVFSKDYAFWLERICNRDWFLYHFDQMEQDYFNALVPYWRVCLNALAARGVPPVLMILYPEDFRGKSRSLLLRFLKVLNQEFPDQKFLFVTKEARSLEDFPIGYRRLNIPGMSSHFIQEKLAHFFPVEGMSIPSFLKKEVARDDSLLDIFFKVLNLQKGRPEGNPGHLAPSDYFLSQEEPEILELLFICSRGKFCLSASQLFRFLVDYTGSPLAVIQERIKRLESLGFLYISGPEKGGLGLRDMNPGLFELIPGKSREDLERSFSHFLEKEREGGNISSLGGLFYALNHPGSGEPGMRVLNSILINLLKIREVDLAESLVNSSLFGKSFLSPELQGGLQNLRLASKIHGAILKRDFAGLQKKIESGDLSLSGAKGLYRGECLLQQASCYLGMKGDSALAQKAIKESLFLFQKEGDYLGCIRADTAMGLNLLSQRKIRNAVDYFEMASRISQQIYEPGAGILSEKMKMVASYLFGNVSLALRSIERSFPRMEREHNFETLIFQFFFKGRILFELGQFREAFQTFDRGHRLCLEYSLDQALPVIKRWMARSLVFLKNEEPGEQILAKQSLTLEGAYFRAEVACRAGDLVKGIEVLKEALALERGQPVYSLEQDNWEDGFKVIEGRLSDRNHYEDVLLDQAKGFYYRLLGLAGNAEQAWEGLRPMCRMDKVYNQQPFGYYFFLYAEEVLSKSGLGSEDERAGLISHAFKLLQTRAGRFDSQQMKQNFFRKNPRNFEIMKKARVLNLI